MPDFNWTDDRVTNLKKLYEAGLSASQIASELGGYVTRNAVIGKIHRLKLSRRAKAPLGSRERMAREKRTNYQYLQQVSKPSYRGAAVPAAALVEAEPDPIAYDNVIPLHQHVSLVELTDANCHWPVGDPLEADFFFCGGKAVTGFPYCAHHSRVAYQPAGDRRRKPGPKPRGEGLTGAWY